MKRVIFAVLCFVLSGILEQGVVFGQEIYQDANGVWTNSLKSDGKEAEIYQDEKGVWKNRSTSQKGGDVGSDIGDGIRSATEAGLTALTYKMAAPIQEILKENGKSLIKDVEKQGEGREIRREQAQRAAEAERQEEYERTHISDISSYERFDASQAGEVKSEWEYFDDPRD